MLANIKKVKNHVYRFRYLSLNVAIANAILRDLDLLVEGQLFKMLISLMVRASAKKRDTAL